MSKKVFMTSVLLLLFLYVAYTIGRLPDAIDAIKSNIPILGDCSSFLDMYNFFTLLTSNSPFSISRVPMLLTYILSFFAGYITSAKIYEATGFSRFLLSMFLSFFYTVTFEAIYIDILFNFTVEVPLYIKNAVDQLFNTI